MAGIRVPWWVNRDSVTHRVTFANGLCSLQLAPGDEGYCSNTFFWDYVGRFPYSVDGTAAASILVEPAPRSVTLRASLKRLRARARLTLRGSLSETRYLAGQPSQQVVVLARHDRYHAFHRIASLIASGGHWQLKVRPRRKIIYIAEANGQPVDGQVWQRAWSRPLKIRIRREA